MKIVSASQLSEEALQRIIDIENVSFTDPWSAAALASERKLGRLWCAVEGESVLGYIVFWTIEDECEIANIAVDPALRGKGIGARLLAAAVSAGAKHFYLEVRCTNSPAIALYSKLGFAEYARRKNYYRNPTEDAILMHKEIL